MAPSAPPAQEPGPIVILGGGLMGLALAHQLARRDQPVQVISRRRSEAAGFVAAGMLAPHAEGLSGDLLALGQASLAKIPAWVAQIEADSGLSCGYRPCGIVVPFASAAERNAHPTSAYGQRLDRRGLEQEVPGIGERWQAGLLFEQDGQIDNRRRLMRALERACVELGVSFEEGSTVLELVRNGSQPNGVLTGIRVLDAAGQQRTLACSQAVLACGAWSSQLLPQLRIVPVKGQMLSLQGPRQALRRVLFGPGTYLVSRHDGLLVVGATSEPEAGFGEGLTPRGQRQLQEGLTALLPEASSWPPMERWWGFRPCTPDQGPLLGAGPIPGIWLACGHHRNGVLLAAITADWVSRGIEAAQGGAPLPLEAAAALEAFRWNRFD